MKILLIGSNGQLGQSFLRLLGPMNQISLTAIDRTTCNITDNFTWKNLESYHFDILINAAAYTQVDQAEIERELAYTANSAFPGFLAQLCKSKNALLVHFSSDYVYHVDSHQDPVQEDHPCHPKSIYGITKFEGEQKIRQTDCKYLIFRTSWIFAPWGKNFVITMMNLAKQHKLLRVVNDQTGSPTYAPHLAECTFEVLRKVNHHASEFKSSIYNLANGGYTTWYDFAKEIFKLTDMNIDITPIPYADYHMKTPRPTNSRLDCSKIINDYGVMVRPWKEALTECLKEMLRNEPYETTEIL